MVKKSQQASPDATDAPDADDLTRTVKASAQQIWLAGLGALSKAQAEGGKVFDALVQQGMSVQRRTQSVAGERLSDAGQRMASMASELSSKASNQWDKLEGLFEERVVRTLNRMGVPSTDDVEALTRRVATLERTVAQLRTKPAATRAARAPRKTAVPRKTAPTRKASSG